MKTDIIVIFIYLILFTVVMVNGDWIMNVILKKVFHLTDQEIFDEDEL